MWVWMITCVLLWISIVLLAVAVVRVSLLVRQLSESLVMACAAGAAGALVCGVVLASVSSGLFRLKDSVQGKLSIINQDRLSHSNRIDVLEKCVKHLATEVNGGRGTLLKDMPPSKGVS